MDRSPWVGTSLSIVSICLLDPLLDQLKRLTSSIAAAHLETECQHYLADPGGPIPFERVDFCVIDFDQDWEKASRTAMRIRQAFRLSSILAISSHSGPDRILKAMHCGCDEYLVKPVDQDRLLEALIPIWLRKRDRLEPPKPTGQVLAFMGVKGGCGVTTLSTHLGTLLARAHKRKTLLVDSHPQSGDVAFYLALTGPSCHFPHLLERAAELDSGLLKGFLLRHRSGVDVLPAPEGLELPAPVSRRALEEVLEFLKSEYEFVLIDCPPGLSESNVTIVGRSDHVFLVAIPEATSLRRVTYYLDYFDRHRHLANITDKVQLVLNCHEGALSDAATEGVVGRPLYWTVPSQKEKVLRAINSGDPSAGAVDSDFMRSLTCWAEEIANQRMTPNEPAGSLASALEPL